MTDSVSEALLLEANLIKRYQPRFNVRLKDDKSYPYIKITLGDDFPRVERTRKLVNDGSRYFGPYASASSVDESMNLVRRLFPFRTCTIDIRDGERALQRPCLLYHIKRCQGPCIEAIDKADYRADIEQVELFLEGRQETAGQGAPGARCRPPSERTRVRAGRRRCATRSGPSSGRWRARRWRRSRRTELDVVGLARQDNQAAIQLFAIRDGKMIGRDVLPARRGPRGVRRRGAGELPRAVLRPRRRRSRREVYVPRRRCRGRGPRGVPRRRGAAGRSTSASPQRGEKRELMALATRNAARDAGPRAGALAGRPGQDPRRARGAGRGARPAPVRRCASSATTSATSRAASRSAAWSSSRTASRAPASTAASGSGPSRARTTSPATRRCCAAASSAARTGEEGSEEELPLGDARPRDHRRRQGPGQRRRRRSSTSWACTTCRSPAWPRSARSCSCPDRRRPDRAAADVAGALPRPAPPRRGAPVRDHVPPRPAREARRSARRSTTCPASARSASASCCKVFGSVKRVREAPVEQIAAVPGHQPRAGRAKIKATPERVPGSRRVRAPQRRCARSVPCIIPPVDAQSRSHPDPPHRRLLALLVDLLPGSRAARFRRAADRPLARRSRPSSASTSQGGLRVEYQAMPATASPPSPGDLAIIRDIIERRVNSTGVSEPVVTDPGLATAIVVELPGRHRPRCRSAASSARPAPRLRPARGQTPGRPDGQVLDLEE